MKTLYLLHARDRNISLMFTSPVACSGSLFSATMLKLLLFFLILYSLHLQDLTGECNAAEKLRCFFCLVFTISGYFFLIVSLPLSMSFMHTTVFFSCESRGATESPREPCPHRLLPCPHRLLPGGCLRQCLKR